MDCEGNCSSCGTDCPSGKKPDSLIEPVNEHSEVENVVAVVSGKGGVGKSLVTALMASKMNKAGYRTAVLDADITGPSIPKVLGIEHQKAEASELGILPVSTKNGISVMSVNLLLENSSTPVIWRGPVVAGVVKQFWTDVIWETVDYMFVDMPPGTGDVPLTVFQSLPIKGIIIVTSPQELVGMIVEKAVRMAKMMNVPVLGIVENMSYFICDGCGKQHSIFGHSHIEEIAKKHGIQTISKIPVDPQIAARCDRGRAEQLEAPWLDNMVEAIIEPE